MENELVVASKSEENVPCTVFDGPGGPKPIGVLDRMFTDLTEDEMRVQLAEVGKILVAKYGPNQFQNELGRQLKKDMVLMEAKPGSNVFIADPTVTVAIMNDENKELLIEIRRPGIPYKRGRIKSRKQLGESFGIQSLLED